MSIKIVHIYVSICTQIHFLIHILLQKRLSNCTDERAGFKEKDGFGSSIIVQVMSKLASKNLFLRGGVFQKTNERPKN